MLAELLRVVEWGTTAMVQRWLQWKADWASPMLEPAEAQMKAATGLLEIKPELHHALQATWLVLSWWEAGWLRLMASRLEEAQTELEAASRLLGSLAVDLLLQGQGV